MTEVSSDRQQVALLFIFLSLMILIPGAALGGAGGPDDLLR